MKIIYNLLPILFCIVVIDVCYKGWPQLATWFVEPVKNDNSEVATNDSVIDIFNTSLCWFTWGTVALFVLYLLSKGTSCITPEKIKKLVWYSINEYLWVAFVLVWILGFATYCVGTYIPVKGNGVSGWDALSVAPMAMIHATGMFIGQSDISAIREGQHHNALYMFFFNTSHLLAVMCSFVFILHLFGFYVVGSMKIWLSSVFLYKWPRLLGLKRSKLYVFWGINEQSLLLAEDIKRRKSKGTVVFVRTFDDEDSQSSQMGFSHFFERIRLKNSDIDRLRRLGCHVTSSFHKLSSVQPDLNEAGKEQPTDILSGKLNRNSLVRMINSTKETNIFILSDDEQTNLVCMRVIVNDTVLCKAKAKTSENSVKIYCHARANSLTCVEEDMHSEGKMQVQIVDTTRLSIEWLKSFNEGFYQPVRHMTINTSDKPGAIASDFNALIVGFGETGRDAFRFLYEYTSLLSDRSEDTKPRGIDFNCDIVDKDNTKYEFGFKYITPNINWEAQTNFKFHSLDINDGAFYSKFLSANSLSTLNYVFISLGNDDDGMLLASRILKQIVKVRTDLCHFRIFLRVYNRQRAKEIKHIAQHYNNIYRECSNEDIIIVFGDPKDLFTVEDVINERLINEAKEFLCEYNKCYKLYHPNDEVKSWEERRESLLSKGKVFQNINELRRKESQDIATAQHKYTKRHIYTQVVNEMADDTPYIKKLMDNLAITEHLRWNAAHEMKGYKLNPAVPKCNEQTMEHNCDYS